MARILVTGAASGLGLNTARALSEAGHEVVVHVRNRSRLSGPESAWPGVLYGDLTDPGQTREVAQQAGAFGPFTAVIHNAGVMDSRAMTVNVDGSYLLTALIERPQRLIYLSSGMHRGGSADLRRIERGQVSYSDSKLYVTALSAAFATRWAGTVSHAVDPGWVPTRMGGRGAPDDLTAGHETQVWLATAESVRPATGGYWYHRELQPTHPSAQDPQFQQALLDVLEKRTGVSLPQA
jgi:NAD(P)-dependent dehydrogenase (short-subunit alcohol dehydrogenase family)